MKISQKTSLVGILALGLIVNAGLMLAHAQETSTTDSIVAIAADSQSLPQLELSSVPMYGGTYWLVYPAGFAAPSPMLPLDVNGPVYGITSNEFLVDLTGGTVSVPPYELAEAEKVTTNAYAAAVTAQVQGLIDLITMVQTPTPAAPTAGSMMLRANPMDGGGGFFPDYSTDNGPYLTIAPTNSDSFLITVWNDQGPVNYELWWTPILANPDYPWTAVAAGTTGQTNFVVPMPQFSTGFYRAVWDTNSVPLWEAADPNNPGAGILTVFIDSPTNGAVIQ